MAVQHADQPVDVLAVLGLRLRADAWPAAQFDVVIEARTRIVPGDLAVTGQVREGAAQHVECFPHPARRRERPEVAVTVVPVDAARHLDGRERIAGPHANVRVVLVVLEQDVVARLVNPDQLSFGDQRLQLVAGQDELDVGGVVADAQYLRVEVARLEVAAHAVAQVLGLAHVDDRAGRVEHLVDARPGRQVVEDVLNVWQRCVFSHS